MKTKNKIQGIATMLWFNQTKGFGEVRFLANQSTAIIFAKDLPDAIKNNPLNDSKEFSLKCVAILHEADSRVFWGNQFVVRTMSAKKKDLLKMSKIELEYELDAVKESLFNDQMTGKTGKATRLKERRMNCEALTKRKTQIESILTLK